MLVDLMIKLYYPYWNIRLTVLAYHRIVTDEEYLIKGSKIAVSTSVSEFERQMSFVNRHFSVITVETLQQWLQGHGVLPKRPLLVTFDDGYQDIYTQVMPVLERLNIPATVFLATDYMGSSRMFQWDLASYYFDQTSLKSGDLPLLGECSWETETQRNTLLKQWLAESKKQTDSAKQAATQALGDVLQVERPTEGKGSTDFLSWDQVRLLQDKGFSFGSHTCQHPILSKIPYAKVVDEVGQSKQKIEQEIAREVLSFAYPNGLANDFNEQVIEAINQAGYQCAFTLLAGPVTCSEVKKQPLQIQRITITEKDSYRRFILKVMGMVRLKQKITQYLTKVS